MESWEDGKIPRAPETGWLATKSHFHFKPADLGPAEHLQTDVESLPEARGAFKRHHWTVFQTGIPASPMVAGTTVNTLLL